MDELSSHFTMVLPFLEYLIIFRTILIQISWQTQVVVVVNFAVVVERVTKGCFLEDQANPFAAIKKTWLEVFFLSSIPLT